jgi:hypothetical protein
MGSYDAECIVVPCYIRSKKAGDSPGDDRACHWEAAASESLVQRKCVTQQPGRG